MKNSRYATPAALRRALDDRLRQRSQAGGEDLARLQRLVAFDRVLARLFAAGDTSSWIVKGGFGLEVRYRLAARTTKDLDLGVTHVAVAQGSGARLTIRALWAQLQAAAEYDTGDGFVVAIGAAQAGAAKRDPTSARFPVEVYLAGRVYSRFHLDVGLADFPGGRREWMMGEDLLGFAGISPARFAVVGVEQQMAEKLHALTKPRGRAANTRVKDLVDLVLLLERGSPNVNEVRRAVVGTFHQEDTHPLPAQLPAPPDGWAAPYAELARETEVTARTVEEAYFRVSELWRTLALDPR